MMPQAYQYKRWQQVLFWVSWLALLIPTYFLLSGFGLLGSLVLQGYTDSIDYVLALIFGSATLLLTWLVYKTYRNFRYQQTSFKVLVLNIWGAGLLVPLAVLLGSVVALWKLTSYL
jgi:NADH:ubiquinone oxidoreductase subunit 4 (subunit M)